ncbi:hypothetical protein B0J13DRAFT_551617 [Dactylonectria estremocensis]|uniref:Uncharacterized protein n=1 Tax=Dactylonectria estremocensis TaxID=1079267 RepID=A0A9P9JAX7_9HYPO|nr:hypothetical protein B0J13DRAFT_551617 [Dactylonectria estremocensis]
MPLTRTHGHTTTARAPRQSIFSRRRAAPRRQKVVTTTTTTRKPRHSLFGGSRTTRATRTPVVHHQQRKPTMKDKVSGALLKLKGSLTHRPAVKAAGTRRMRGTDGRGSRRRRFM